MIALGTLKEHLQINPSDTTFDGLLNDYIAWATYIIEDYCEKPIAPKLLTIPIQNYGVLPVNVTFVASLEGRNSVTDAWTTLSLTDYNFAINGTYQFFVIESTYQYYQATVLAGLVPVPSTIVKVCYDMCKQMAQDDGILGGEATFRTVQTAKTKGGDTTTTVLKDLTSEHKRLLAPHKYVSLL